MSDGVGGSELNHDLIQILQGPRSTPGGILHCLDEVRRNHPGQPTYSRLVGMLTGLALEEPVAERSLGEIARHWASMLESLGRDPGLSVATFDYFVNVDPRLKSPRMIERERYDEIERQAETDALTGMSNRRHFAQTVRSELRRSGRYGLSTAILFLDLDDFKRTNDLWGHQFGDVVLQEVARTLRSLVRDVDLLGRYGGEEFAVLLPETTKEGATVVAERIRRSIAERFSKGEVDRRRLDLTISGGIAVFPDDGWTMEALIQRADEALYTAKSLGKNRIVASRGDRRRSSRFDLSDSLARMSLTVSDGEGGPSARSIRAREISRSGALVETESSLQLGSRVKLRFEPSDSASPPILVEGRVVRRQERETQSGRLFEHGIAFDTGAGESREELDRLLASTVKEDRRH